LGLVAWLSGQNTIAGEPELAATGWARHSVFPRGGDGTGGHGGPDGVRLGDFNRDGLTDIVTPFEEGKRTRIFANPGPDKVMEHWPYVLVSETTETLRGCLLRGCRR
jgi:hypothetical protein